MSAQPLEWIQLAPMHPAHLAQVVDIERRAFEFPWTERIFDDCLKVGYSAWVLIDLTEQVRGYVLMTLAVGEAHILNLCVDPVFQRRGLGRRMLNHLLKLADSGGVTLVLLEVRESNRSALGLYRGYGFQEIGRRRRYYPAREGREDALVLALERYPVSAQ